MSDKAGLPSSPSYGEYLNQLSKRLQLVASKIDALLQAEYDLFPKNDKGQSLIDILLEVYPDETFIGVRGKHLGFRLVIDSSIVPKQHEEIACPQP